MTGNTAVREPLQALRDTAVGSVEELVQVFCVGNAEREKKASEGTVHDQNLQRFPAVFKDRHRLKASVYDTLVFCAERMVGIQADASDLIRIFSVGLCFSDVRQLIEKLNRQRFGKEKSLRNFAAAVS